MTMILHLSCMPITMSKLHKKAQQNPSSVDKVQHMHKIDPQITHTHASHSGTHFNVATYTKNLFLAILHHDETIAIKANDSTLHIVYVSFPKDKEQFCCYFNIHTPMKHPKHCNKMVIRCIILSNCTIPNIKQSQLTNTT